MALGEFILPESMEQARAIQEELRRRVRIENDFSVINSVAGVDVGYDPALGLAQASIVTMPLDSLKMDEQVQVSVPVSFPYIPGFLSFREIPAILAAVNKLSRLPDLWMVDGQGIAHPRRFGIAAHLGVLLDMPSIGIAKSRLAGRHGPLGPRKGDYVPLLDGKECIGTVLRSRDGVNPLFISPGHKVDMETALALTLRCLTRYRLPEPTRLADKFSKYRSNTLPLFAT